jgi:flagellar motor switch protein FliG
LTTVTPTRGAELLADEPPALAAMLLLSLPRDTAAAILVQLPADRQTDVALRLTTTAPPSAAVGAQLERALRAKAARCRQEEARNGEHALDALLPAEGPEFDDPVCDTEAASASSFHLLHRVDRWVLRAAFRFASTADLCHALRGADPRLRDYLLSALAPEHRRTVQYRLRTTQALPVRVITAAQARLVELVRTAPSSAEEADAVPLRTPVHA